ncbi:MAG TPA: choice-of-anchor tandem repeat GloVer-containing protein [Terriglobales bacterium]|nr:choice-of-anchor tandem repeat GloVer-containing protein [Terriglobales bacterium]
MRKSIVSRSLRLLAATVTVCVLTAFTQAQLQPNKAASYKEKVLHAFTGKSDGAQPTDLVRDANGNLYGATAFGGNMSGRCGQQYGLRGCGIVFELSAKGKFKVLHTFDFSDGVVPGNLVYDASGNLYGTATWGGNSACQNEGCGVIFKLTSAGAFTLLYKFTGGSDGLNPNGLTMGAKGNLYGTACCGEVFQLTASGKLEVLYSFTETGTGLGPEGVIEDSAGNLYGTTFGGGDTSCSLYEGSGCGLVYKLDTSGKETVLYSFKGRSDGAFPASTLIMDKAGNLYGTASLGGDEKGVCHLSGSPVGCGTVFKIDTAGAFSVLVKFDGSDGLYPGTLTEDAHGIIFGTTDFGGNVCCGVVYKLTAGNKEAVLYNFKRQSDGGWPVKVVEDTKGNLYGTTLNGGDLSCAPGQGVGCGVIFELTP